MALDLLKTAQELWAIGQFLDSHTIPERSDLTRLSTDLSKLNKSISEMMATSPDLRENLSKQQELVEKLKERCRQLEVRRSIIDLAESAEKLANESPDKESQEIAAEAEILRSKIDALLQNQRPSRNNAKFIRFAHACIDKAEKHEPVISNKKRSKNVLKMSSLEDMDTSIDSFDLAESLYSLAGLLYREDLDGFAKSLSRDFSDSSLKEIRFHVGECQGDISKTERHEDRIRIIQGILGYAHKVSDYYMDSSPYPSLIEIHRIFDDLELVTYLEESDPTEG